MARRLKSDDKISKTGKAAREYFRKNPDVHEKVKRRQREYYEETKPARQLQKKLKSKEQREHVYEKLGLKCSSCGEEYNPHAKRSNLQIDHKFYLKSTSLGYDTVSSVLKLIENGIDPSLQFNLLCYPCHMVVTHIRKNPQKANSVLSYLRKNNIMKEHSE
jgi:hypothetical protein